VVDLLAAVFAEKRTERTVVPFDEVVPGRVADRLEEVCRPTDVGEEERAGCSLGGAAAREELGGAARPVKRPEALKDRLRRLELDHGRVVVGNRLVGLGQHRARHRGLVRRAERCQRRTASRSGDTAEPHSPSATRTIPLAPGRRGLERLRAEECGERGELTGGGARCLELLGADGELDESREQPRALDVISRHVGERALELPETDARLPLGEPE